MIEKVNKYHPDKVADRIAGAIVDLAYKAKKRPKIAVEVLIGHNECTVIVETDCDLNPAFIKRAIKRIAGKVRIHLILTKQDEILNENIGAGDNGIFKGLPITEEEKKLSDISFILESRFQSDGKYILDGEKLIICQSNATEDEIREILRNNKIEFPEIIINPLGEWSGGINVDTGATNRKLGSDLGHSVTGGGINGKDCSKADVCLNLWCFYEAQITGKPVELSCAIGDREINGRPFSYYREWADQRIKELGGFEKLAEGGLI